MRGKRWPRAKELYAEALRILPPASSEQRKELLYLLALGSARANELAVAIAHADALIELDPAYREIARLRSEWQE